MSSNSVCNHTLDKQIGGSRCAVVRFCYHSYDYRLNWTPLNPITITEQVPSRVTASEKVITIKYQEGVGTRKRRITKSKCLKMYATIFW